MLSLFMCFSLSGCFWKSKKVDSVSEPFSVNEHKTSNDEEENMYGDYSYDGSDYDDYMEEDEL